MRRNFEINTQRRQQQVDAKAEKHRMIQEEFAGMLAAGTLTNAQRVAVTSAAELLGIKL